MLRVLHMTDFSHGFRTLNDEEVGHFQKWTENNYRAGQPISETWHPVVREHAERLTRQHDRRRQADETQKL